MWMIKTHRGRRIRSTRYRAPLVWLCLAMAGCAAPPPPDAGAEIRALLEGQVAGWNAGDIAGFMAPYWHSDSLRFASGGSVTYGWQATFDRYSRRYPNRTAMGQLAFTDLDVTILSADAALVFGKWQLQRETDAPWGRFTLLLRKKGEEWVIVHDHTSPGEDAP